MKNILFTFILMIFVSVASQAQSSCCSKKTADAKSCNAKTEQTTKVASMYMEADKIAELDPSIKKRICSISGAVSYYQKLESPEESNVEWVQVEFDEEKKVFTRVASAYQVRNLSSTAPSSSEKVKTKACCKGSKKCAKKEGV